MTSPTDRFAPISEPTDDALRFVEVVDSFLGRLPFPDWIDRRRLSYAPGFPGSRPGELRECVVLDAAGRPEARLSCAVAFAWVRVVIGPPGERRWEGRTKRYGYFRTSPERDQAHQLLVAWRVTRVGDGKVLHDSLEDPRERCRVLRSGVPLQWSEVVSALRWRGEISWGQVGFPVRDLVQGSQGTVGTE